MLFANSVQRQRSSRGAGGGTSTVAQHLVEEQGVRAGDRPPGQAVPGSAGAVTLSQAAQQCLGWVFPPLSCREGRGGSSNVTASVHKLELPGLVSSLFPHFLIFPIAGSRDGTGFAGVRSFFSTTTCQADGTARLWTVAQGQQWVALPLLTKGDSSHRHLC